MERNGGVHEWNRRNDGMRVFQEWIALLTLARDQSREKRRQIGLDLETLRRGRRYPARWAFSAPAFRFPATTTGISTWPCSAACPCSGCSRTIPLLLTDRTLLHLVTRVVRLWGQSSKADFDVFFVSVPETENHLFMIESTRFLTNQLIWENVRGLEPLAALRDSLTRAGVVLDNRQGRSPPPPAQGDAPGHVQGLLRIQRPDLPALHRPCPGQPPQLQPRPERRRRRGLPARLPVGRLRVPELRIPPRTGRTAGPRRSTWTAPW